MLAAWDRQGFERYNWSVILNGLVSHQIRGICHTYLADIFFRIPRRKSRQHPDLIKGQITAEADQPVLMPV